MIEVLSAENMRQSDADTIASGVPGRELMLRAGRGIVEAAEEVCGWESPCAIVCGSGNNGGDGYVIAQLLAKKGIDCRIFLMKERFTADGAFYFEGCRQMGIPSALCTQETDFTGYRRIVDCIFGTGLSGPAEGLAAKVIGKINAAGRTGSVVISADINSGLNADNGQGEPCVQSDLTVAVGGWKYGHFLGSAMDVMKEKRSCGIGIRPSRRPAYLVEAADVRACFPERRHESNKGSFGYLALIGGSIR